MQAIPKLNVEPKIHVEILRRNFSWKNWGVFIVLLIFFIILITIIFIINHHSYMKINQVQPGGGCHGKCNRVARAGTTKPGNDDDLVDVDVDDHVEHADDDDHDDQLIHYLEVDSTVVDDAVVVDVHDVENVHTYKKKKRST